MLPPRLILLVIERCTGKKEKLCVLRLSMDCCLTLFSRFRLSGYLSAIREMGLLLKDRTKITLSIKVIEVVQYPLAAHNSAMECRHWVALQSKWNCHRGTSREISWDHKLFGVDVSQKMQPLNNKNPVFLCCHSTSVLHFKQGYHFKALQLFFFFSVHVSCIGTSLVPL